MRRHQLKHMYLEL